MPRPHEAVRAAIEELWSKDEFELSDVVDLAETKLGEDEEFYRRQFLRIALAKKAADALRAYREPPAEVAPVQNDLFGDLPQRRLAVPQDDGNYVYRRVKRMNWSDLRLVHADRRTGLAKGQKEINGLEDLMRRLAPMMALNDALTVEEAIASMQQRTAAE